ncbi:MbnB/TglH/ChrH family RiPP precursor modification enzyme [Achromobacter xylosoxidans]|uniref:DUF692 domain-containing protein n=1 Tax=Alcaligenes xylosoxydans xylosoxydans TaxID=85698 RepID=UPI00071C93F6|nr:DUF692 domain-containing protein [Achromobacter xylosoxidans]
MKALIERYEPGLFSEHLAWSSHDAGYLDDLLPVPYTNEALQRICQHVDEVQTFLGQQMLLENPATYVQFQESTWGEAAFIREIVRRTGCGLLLDVNNVYVACTNQRWDALGYLQDFPFGAVQEIHLAGHSCQVDEKGRPLLIDSHDQLVDEEVWKLFRRTITYTGPVATLIEWDAKIPKWHELQAQAARADGLMRNLLSTQERSYATPG